MAICNDRQMLRLTITRRPTTILTFRIRPMILRCVCSCRLLVLSLAFGFPVASGQVQGQDAADWPTTTAERTEFRSTSTYADVMEFCESLDAKSSVVHLSSMGQTSEGRTIPLLILADPPIQTASQASQDDRPVVFVMANIHAGEVCGKEASLMVARQLVSERSPLLKQLIIVVAPIYNADGNERFSTTNRPGQIGPVNGMGQRPNAMGLDLNRDHMKLESPEARSQAKLFCEWKPIVAMDLHTTDGSFHRYDLTYDSPRHPATDVRLLEFGRDRFLPDVTKQLTSQHQLKTFFYGNFDRNHKNWLSYPAAPRYSTHYWGLRHCLGVLSEAYAYTTFQERVIATQHFVDAVLRHSADQRDSIRKLVAHAAGRFSGSNRQSVKIPIRAVESPLPGTVRVPGWEEEIAGRGRVASDDDKPTEYEVIYHGGTTVTLDVTMPDYYLIDADQQAAIQNLTQHGIEVQILDQPLKVSATQYTVTNFKQAATEFQGHRLISNVDVTSTPSIKTYPPGTAKISTNQPLAALLVNLVEPQAADGLTAWNFFDAELEEGTFPVSRVEFSSDKAPRN